MTDFLTEKVSLSFELLLLSLGLIGFFFEVIRVGTELVINSPFCEGFFLPPGDGSLGGGIKRWRTIRIQRMMGLLWVDMRRSRLNLK